MTSRGSSADSLDEQVSLSQQIECSEVARRYKAGVDRRILQAECAQITATLRAGGVTRAADIIEQAIFTGKPVLAQTQQIILS